MAKILMYYTYYLIVLGFCVDRGDGRWKKKDDRKETLQHDINIFKKMAEKIEHEIEVFYEDYSDKKIKGDDIGKINPEFIQNTLDSKTDTNDETKRKKGTIFNFTYTLPDNISKDIKTVNIRDYYDKVDLKQKSNINVSSKNNSVNKAVYSWPKFEDILLAMGKRYDWKNDRWVKVKGKLKELRQKKVEEVDNRVSFHETHKFSYRTVKLNRSKSRRNIVIAVSAVR